MSTLQHLKNKKEWGIGALLLLVGAAAACSNGDQGMLGDDLGGGGGGTGDGGATGQGTVAQQAARAEQLFHDTVEAPLKDKCGGCHITGTTGNAPTWLKDPAYQSIKAYPGIVGADVYASKLLTKPVHLGGSLQEEANADLRGKVTDWLNAEALVLENTQLPATDPQDLQDGVNTVDITKAGTGVDGAKLTFNATITKLSSGTVVELTSLMLVSPAATGVHIVHPIFTMVPTQGADVPDVSDHFSNLDQTVGAGKTAQLGDGTLYLFNWQDGAKLKIEMTKLVAGTTGGDGGTTGGGCKSPNDFTASAVPALQGNGCLGCHQGQNGGATGAVDMSNVGKDNNAACAQVLTKVNLADKPNSAIILAPTTGNNLQHGGGKNLAPNSQFVTSMLAWINKE